MSNQSTECLSLSSRIVQTGHSSFGLHHRSLLIDGVGPQKVLSDKDYVCMLSNKDSAATNENSDTGSQMMDNDHLERCVDADMLDTTAQNSLTTTNSVGASLDNSDAINCSNDPIASNLTIAANVASSSDRCSCNNDATSCNADATVCNAANVASNLGRSSCNKDATSCNSDVTLYNADATLCNIDATVSNTEDIKRSEDRIIGIQSDDSEETCHNGAASLVVIDTNVKSNQQESEGCKYCIENIVTREEEENIEYLAKTRETNDGKKKEVNIVENYEAHIEEPFIVAINRCSSKSKSSVRLSLISNSSIEGHCRICHCGGEDETLISPCNCSGSLQYVHESCLVHWMQCKMVDSCELCQRKIEVVRQVKPFCSWKRPTQRPSPLLWLATFFVAFALNVASVVKDASNSCTSTNCVVFYIVGCIGAILTSSFGVYFAIRARDFFKHWKTMNEHWVIIDKNCLHKQQQTGYDNRTFSLFSKFFSRQRITTVV